MRFASIREPLSEAVSLVGHAVRGADKLPILQTVLLEVKDNVLTVTGTDLEQTMSCAVPVSDGVDGAVCVDAKKMAALMKAGDGASVVASLDDASLKMECGPSTWRLNSLAASEFPPRPDAEGGLTFAVFADKFVDELERVGFCQSEEENRPVLMGIQLQTGGEVKLTATDGRRLANLKSGDHSAKEEGSVVIPSRAVAQMLPMLKAIAKDAENSDPVRLTLGENSVSLVCGERRLTSKVIDGTYPNWQQVVPRVDGEGHEASGEAFEQVLRRMNCLVSEKDSRVDVHFKEDRIAFSTKSEDGEGAESIPLSLPKGTDRKTAFNCRYLLEAIRSLKGADFRFWVPEENAAFKFTDAGWQHIIMPMRAN